MTEKELTNDIIVKMLDYKDKKNVSINDFCKAKKIKFSSDVQKERIFNYLKDKGYIDANVFIGGDANFTITSKVLTYPQTLSAKTNKLHFFDKKLSYVPTDEERDPISSYTAKENNRKIIDNNVPACFNVKGLAECYVKLIDRACENKENNVCLFGIFAPWGRGKSYFFRKVKEHINGRKETETVNYDIVEFNASKYQETPAIWAYLFETLYNSKGQLFKFFYTIKRNWESIISDLLKYSIPIIIIFFISAIDCLNNININKWYGVAGFLSASLFICKLLLKHYNSALSIMKEYSKGISFANELGVQAEIEKEITSLLKSWIGKKKTDKKKVILYIDDIDRCSETKMTSIIDSLRTVLENEEIRKRLIIICSIDPNKIIKGIEYKYIKLYDDKELRSIAIDQMDKIFLTGIALSPLDNDQLLEFASKLARVYNNSINIDGQLAQTVENRDKIISDFQEQKRRNNLNLTDLEIYYQLKNLIKENEKQLTPRKIRIIYYRILLANNIICKMENPKITKALIQNIFNLSVGEKMNHDETSEELSDILNMVVPYKYKEEEEVKNHEGEVAIQS